MLERFGDLLFEATDCTMRQIFGKSAELIYTLMERHVMVKREEVGEKIGIFYSYLERLLGSEGVHVIQNASIKRLCLKLSRNMKKWKSTWQFSTNSTKLSLSFWFPPQKRDILYTARNF